SAACGGALVLYAAWAATRHLDLDDGGTLAVAAVLGLSPAFACWSTSGLETMPTALALFALFERLVLADGRRTWVGAAVAGCALALLRTEGPAWVVAIAALALVVRRARRDALAAPWWLPPVATLAVVVPLVAAHVGWRWS